MSEDARRLSTRDVARAATEPTPSDRDDNQRFSSKDAARPEHDVRTPPDEPERAALFHGDEASGFRSRWEAIQTGFVDEPRAAVEEADALVAQVTTRLAQIFAEGRTELETRWNRGENVSTEDLRISLKRYRSFFDRLLAM